MDIDEILERAEKLEDSGMEGVEENELLNQFKVANFCSAEDDASFWSRWIKPDAISQVEEALAPRAARNAKSYVETFEIDGNNKRKNKVSQPSRPNPKRCRGESVPLVPIIRGASAQVREWSYGNLTKRDASRFAKDLARTDSVRSLIPTIGEPMAPL